jgi:hypothetical protein
MSMTATTPAPHARRKRSTASDARRANLLAMSRALKVPVAEVRAMFGQPEPLAIPMPALAALSTPQPKLPAADFSVKTFESCHWVLRGGYARAIMVWDLPTRNQRPYIHKPTADQADKLGDMKDH